MAIITIEHTHSATHAAMGRSRGRQAAAHTGQEQWALWRNSAQNQPETQATPIFCATFSRGLVQVLWDTAHGMCDLGKCTLGRCHSGRDGLLQGWVF